MKCQWEPADIWCGRVTKYSDGTQEKWMIGYDATIRDSRKHYCLISLNDGMIMLKNSTAEEVCKHLTEAKLEPDEIVNRRN